VDDAATKTEADLMAEIAEKLEHNRWIFLIGNGMIFAAVGALTILILYLANKASGERAQERTGTVEAITEVSQRSIENEARIKVEREAMLNYIKQSLDYIAAMNPQLKVPKALPPAPTGESGSPYSRHRSLDRTTPSPSPAPPPTPSPTTQPHHAHSTRRAPRPRPTPQPKPWYNFFKSTR
jgi:hypothetical protein